MKVGNFNKSCHGIESVRKIGRKLYLQYVLSLLVRSKRTGDHGYCAGQILFRIQDGISNSISLAGRDVVLLFDWPGPTLLDGNAASRLYVDDAADTNQQKEL